MNLFVESFLPQKHYEIVSSWWQAHAWPVIPLSHLPSTGIVVNVDGVPGACAWIYKTDSAFCLLEWFIVNPKIRREARAEAIARLISSAIACAKALGFNSIFVTARSESLISRLEKHGFSVADKNMKNLILNFNEVSNGG